jgi:hypothetical protein
MIAPSVAPPAHPCAHASCACLRLRVKLLCACVRAHNLHPSMHACMHPLKQMNSSIIPDARTHARPPARPHARTVYVEDCARLALKYPRFERALVDPIDAVQNSERREHPPAPMHRSCKPICTKPPRSTFIEVSPFHRTFLRTSSLCSFVAFSSVAFRGRR